MEPNRNDSDHGLGNASFDPHIDSIPMDDDPIEPHPYEVEFFDPTQESPQRAREWMVSGNRYYSIQTIPTMIPSIDEHKIYEGAMFMSKDELKCALGKFALKVKFEYRILWSYKIRFKASCVNIGYNFQLCATMMKWGNYWRVKIFVKDHTCDMEIFKNCHRY